jgi:3-methylfumaryl-CoA hydratase
MNVNDDYSTWIGRQEVVADTLEAPRASALRAALGVAEPLHLGETLPTLYHWLYFWNVLPPTALGPDGHPAKGGFLPPIPLPRRMWAGGRIKFLNPLIIGERVTRTSTILKIETKIGKSGTLVFVTIEHQLSGEASLSLVEEQDIVYREPAPAAASSPPTNSSTLPSSEWHRSINPDPILLFRYSALTMNGHRIHYDRPYATNTENYPALVVHGPLQATLMADLFERNAQKTVTGFEFRGQSPAYDTAPLSICGTATVGGANLWTEQGGVKAMVATATFDA